MEYVLAALLLHKAGQKIDENAVKKVLEAAGVQVNDARVKALIAALEGVDIEQAISKAAPVAVAAAPAGGAVPSTEAPEKKEEKKEEVSEEDAATGLSGLFG